MLTGQPPLLQHSQIQFVVLTFKDLPCHFDIAVGRNIDRRRRCLLSQRQAQRPATKNVPLLDSCMCLQPNKLFFGLIVTANDVPSEGGDIAGCVPPAVPAERNSVADGSFQRPSFASRVVAAMHRHFVSSRLLSCFRRVTAARCGHRYWNSGGHPDGSARLPDQHAKCSAREMLSTRNAQHAKCSAREMLCKRNALQAMTAAEFL